LLRILGIDSPLFSMPPLYLRKGSFSVQKMGSTTQGHGSLQSPTSYYHQGVTGVAVWCDPTYQIAAVYLSTLRAFDASTDEFDWDFDLFQNLVSSTLSSDSADVLS
ncbi:MAG: hypothetical protein ABL995_16250, partial [Bryobacteraceae bacterium]